MKEWKVAQTELLFSHRIMDLERRSTTDGEDRREAIVLRAPDWVNVIPLLDDGQVVMIRQWRHGIQAPTLEVPGGGEISHALVIVAFHLLSLERR